MRPLLSTFWFIVVNALVLLSWLLITATAPASTLSTLQASDLFSLEIATDPQISPDGETVAYVRVSNDIVSDRAIQSVWLVDVVTSAQRPVEGSAHAQRLLPYIGGEFSVARDGTVAYTGGTFDRPADIFIAHHGEHRPLTRNNEDLLASKRLATVQELPVTSFEGRPIQAWVALPPGFDSARTYPMILKIHGGPFQAYGPYFSTDFQLFAAAGYVVLFVNPRGSTTYGSEFANLIHHDFPGRDYEDLMGAVDTAVSKFNIDDNRLFVTGGSGGGILTAWIVGRTNRFRAAAAYKPVINWSSFVLTSDLPNVWHRYLFGRQPWEDPQAYWRRSPLSLAGKIETPTLLVVGTSDHRTPPSEAEQLYQALQLRGIPTSLVLIPDARHGGALRPSQDIARIRATLAWFARHGTAPPDNGQTKNAKGERSHMADQVQDSQSNSQGS